MFLRFTVQNFVHKSTYALIQGIGQELIQGSFVLHSGFCYLWVFRLQPWVKRQHCVPSPLRTFEQMAVVCGFLQNPQRMWELGECPVLVFLLFAVIHFPYFHPLFYLLWRLACRGHSASVLG